MIIEYYSITINLSLKEDFNTNSCMNWHAKLQPYFNLFSSNRAMHQVQDKAKPIGMDIHVFEY